MSWSHKRFKTPAETGQELGLFGPAEDRRKLDLSAGTGSEAGRAQEQAAEQQCTRPLSNREEQGSCAASSAFEQSSLRDQECARKGEWLAEGGRPAVQKQRRLLKQRRRAWLPNLRCRSCSLCSCNPEDGSEWTASGAMVVLLRGCKN